MLDLDGEVAALRDLGRISSGRAERLIALERREVFPIAGELRILSYSGVLLIVTGLGIVLKNNLDRLGPLFVTLLLIAVTAACYSFPLRTKFAGRARTAVADYVLLLAALLFSATAGYAQSQFHFAGSGAQLFLLLALVHALTAYWLDSRLVLSVALTALAAWFGVDQHLTLDSLDRDLSGSTFAYGAKALLCSLTVFALQLLNRVSPRGRPAFDSVYVHFAATFGFMGALFWTFDDSMRWIGVGITAVLATVFVIAGMRTRSEAFVLYGFVYSAIALFRLVFVLLADGVLIFLTCLILSIASIATLFWIHQKMKAGE